MATIKKYNGSTWENAVVRKFGTATEAVENPLYSGGTPITSYTIKGNTVQNGTPSSSSPVEVNGVGVRTGNLIYFQALLTAPTGYIEDVQFEHVLELTLEPNTTYTMSSTGSGSEGGTADANRSLYFNKSGASNGCVYEGHPISNTTDSTGKVKVGFMSSRTNAQQYINGDAVIMFNVGSTRQPYEPYGYKIPISSANTTTPVYLGEVQTTRKIKKLVLDGTEGWTITSNGVLRIGLSGQLRPSTPICTHYSGSNATAWSNVPDKSVTVSISGYLAILDTTYTTVADFKTFLQQQYAAGTPVTVWYVLATPETAAVNEPLMKIGTYTDTLSNATAIPTTEGANSITVDTTVQPSEFTATWTGWHDASVKEWDGSQWNE